MEIIDICKNDKWYSKEHVVIAFATCPDINIQNTDGETALMLAAVLSNTSLTPEMVRMLIDAGANLDIKNTRDISFLDILYTVLYNY